jgi:hypothetical protein
MRKVKGAHGQDISDTDIFRQHNETGNAAGVRSVTCISLPYLSTRRLTISSKQSSRKAESRLLWGMANKF